MPIGHRLEHPIRVRRQLLGISQRELARRAGLPKTAIHFLERGYAASAKHLIAIAEILKCSPADLEVRDDQ
jgi:transcriptional regulator with XRE-family HTH domain